MEYKAPKIVHKGELKQFAGSPFKGSGDGRNYTNDVDSDTTEPGRGVWG